VRPTTLTTTWDALHTDFHMPLSPEWAKLPKRHCDDCGKLYKPVRPRREGEMGFCCDNHRKNYHKHQGAYSKLKGEMQKMVTKAISDLRKELFEIARTEVVGALARSTPAHVSSPQSRA
jgi:hypothetical protein